MWGQAADALDKTPTLHGDHLPKQSLHPGGSLPAQVGFAAFGADKHARPGGAKSLGSRFMGLQLELSTLNLVWHSYVLLS